MLGTRFLHRYCYPIPSLTISLNSFLCKLLMLSASAPVRSPKAAHPFADITISLPETDHIALHTRYQTSLPQICTGNSVGGSAQYTLKPLCFQEFMLSTSSSAIMFSSSSILKPRPYEFPVVHETQPQYLRNTPHPVMM